MQVEVPDKQSCQDRSGDEIGLAPKSERFSRSMLSFVRSGNFLNARYADQRARVNRPHS